MRRIVQFSFQPFGSRSPARKAKSDSAAVSRTRTNVAAGAAVGAAVSETAASETAANAAAASATAGVECADYVDRPAGAARAVSRDLHEPVVRM